MPTTARWAQIATAICDDIRSGTYPIGERITPQSQLAATHGVTNGTVVRAIRWLRERGVLDTEQGIGVFVVRQPEPADEEFPTGRSWRQQVDAALDELRTDVEALKRHLR